MLLLRYCIGTKKITLECMKNWTLFPVNNEGFLRKEELFISSLRGNAYCIGLHISFEGTLPKHIWRVFHRRKGRGVHF